MYTLAAIKIILFYVLLIFAIPALIIFAIHLGSALCTIGLSLTFYSERDNKESYFFILKIIIGIIILFIPVYYFNVCTSNPYEGKGSFVSKTAHYAKEISVHPISKFVWSYATVKAYERECEELEGLQKTLEKFPEKEDELSETIEKKKNRTEKFREQDLDRMEYNFWSSVAPSDHPMRIKYYEATHKNK